MIRLIPPLITILNLGVTLAIIHDHGLEYWGELMLPLNISLFVGVLASLKIENSILTAVATKQYVNAQIAVATVVALVINFIFLIWLTFSFGVPSLFLISLSTSLLTIFQVRNLKLGKILLNYVLNILYTFVPYSLIYLLKPSVNVVGYAYLINSVIVLFLTLPYLRDSYSLRIGLKFARNQIYYTLPQTLVNQVRVRLVYLLLPYNLNPSEIGLFNLIERIAGIISSTIAMVVRPIYMNMLNSGRTMPRRLPAFLVSLGFVSSVVLLFEYQFGAFAWLLNCLGVKLESEILVTGFLIVLMMSVLNWADKIYEYNNTQVKLLNIELVGALGILAALQFASLGLAATLFLISMFYLVYSVNTYIEMRGAASD